MFSHRRAQTHTHTQTLRLCGGTFGVGLGEASEADVFGDVIGGLAPPPEEKVHQSGFRHAGLWCVPSGNALIVYLYF